MVLLQSWLCIRGYSTTLFYRQLAKVQKASNRQQKYSILDAVTASSIIRTSQSDVDLFKTSVSVASFLKASHTVDIFSQRIEFKRNLAHVPAQPTDRNLTKKQIHDAKLADRDFPAQCERFIARTGFLFENLIDPQDSFEIVREEMEILDQYKALEEKILDMQRSGSGIQTAYLAVLAMALVADARADEESFETTLRLACRHLLRMLFTVLEGIVDIQSAAHQNLHLYEERGLDKHARVIDWASRASFSLRTGRTTDRIISCRKINKYRTLMVRLGCLVSE